MRPIRQILLIMIAGISLVSCSKTKYRKTKGGLPYQVFAGKDTQRVKAGEFIKASFIRKITKSGKDSIVFTTEGTLPVYLQINTDPQPYDISEIWTSLKVGDSVVATQMIDTFMKRNPGSIPPEYHAGDKITYYFKVLAAFSSDSLARADFDKTNKQWLVGEVKGIEKFLADKNITAQKTPSGAYVQILSPGTGDQIDSGKYVSVNYSGVSWSGKKFDSNTDSTFGHVGPYPFVVGTGSMIKGFDEAVMMMKLGTKAKVWIPSVLAYAGNPSSPLIKPYENLVFDIEVVDVKNAPPQANRPMPPVEKVDAAQPPH